MLLGSAGWGGEKEQNQQQQQNPVEKPIAKTRSRKWSKREKRFVQLPVG